MFKVFIHLLVQLSEDIARWSLWLEQHPFILLVLKAGSSGLRYSPFLLLMRPSAMIYRCVLIVSSCGLHIVPAMYLVSPCLS